MLRSSPTLATRMLIVALWLLQRDALAHETWLLPDSFSPATDSTVMFRMTSGMGFPALGSVITADRVLEAKIASGTDTKILSVVKEIEGALELSGKAERGSNCAWVRLAPRILQIDEHDAVTHYLEEIGAPDHIWSTWRATRDEDVWRESYRKLAKTALRTEDASNLAASTAEQGCWTQASTGRLELIPATDPTALEGGDSLKVRVTFDGQPLAGLALGLLREGDTPGPLLRSDEGGQATLTLGGPGRYMIYATHLRPAKESEYNWESDFITYTFEVRNRS